MSFDVSSLLATYAQSWVTPPSTESELLDSIVSDFLCWCAEDGSGTADDYVLSAFSVAESRALVDYAYDYLAA